MLFTFTFLGPAPFLNISTSVALIDGILALGGVGYAFVMVSTFSRAQSEVLKKGFSDDIETYLMISGIFHNVNYKSAINSVSLAHFINFYKTCNFIHLHVIFLGLWSSSFYLGAFLGPSVSGFLVEEYGFEWTTVIFSVMYCIAVILNAYELIYTFCIQKTSLFVVHKEEEEVSRL